MFCHLIRKDNKFPGAIRRLWEDVAPGEHLYFVIGADASDVEKFEGIHAVNSVAELVAKLPVSPEKISGVILSGILANAKPYLRVFPEKTPIAWVIWGVELYQSIGLSMGDLYGPRTRRLRSRGPLEICANRARWVRSNLIGTRNQAVIRRVRFFLTQLQAEFEILEQVRLANPSSEWVCLPVVRLADVVGAGNEVEIVVDDNAVQVGNSGWAINNHLEAFECIASAERRFSRVCVPLSYGEPTYIKRVVKEGARLFGERFDPILEFLPLEAYLRRVASCGTVVMNHRRQAGLGNILASLWRGANVHLCESSTLTDYRRLGLSVWRLDDGLDVAVESGGSIVDRRARNRCILESHIGQTAAIERGRGLLEMMANV